MDPQINSILQEIDALVRVATSNLQFPANRSGEMLDFQQRATSLVTSYKQEMLDKAERVKRDLNDYKDRMQGIVDEVNRTT